MTTTIRTLVGVKIGNTFLPCQSANTEQNLEWLELKATSSIANDLVALKRRMPELTCETYDVKGLWTLLSSNIYKIDDVGIYLGAFSSTPTSGYFFSGTGVLIQKAEDAVIYIDSISGDVGEPLRATFKVRGSPISTASENLTSFTLSHSAVNTIAGLSYGETTIGLRNFELSTNIEFYDHYSTDIDPELSAITNINIIATATVLIDDYLAIEAITEATDFIINLNKYQAGGLPQVPGGSIVLDDCAVKVVRTSASIGSPGTAEVELRPKNISITLL